MGIFFDSQSQTFHLQAKHSSYIIQLIQSRYLAHIHWGSKVCGTNLGNLLQLKKRCSFSPSTDPDNLNLSLDTLPQELPSYGTGDLHVPVYQVQGQ